MLLSWNNPGQNLNGDALSTIESVTLRRNNQVIATFTDAEVGASMTYQDDNLDPGLYEYAIYVTNEAGISRNVYRTVMVGDKCEVTFVLRDEGGNGWKGAAISVTDENGQRIAVIGMEDGAEQTVTVPLLKQNLNFIWNHGWYHTTEEYDTDYECSFSVLDSYGNELYVSSDLEDGVFMTYDNNCEYAPLACYPVRNLQGEYVWNNGEEFGAKLTWDAPMITPNLDHFVIMDDMAEKEVVTIPYTGAQSYEYVDLVDLIGDYLYSVHSVYVRGEESCESADESVSIMVTDLEEHVSKVNVYPNPSKGAVNVEGTGHVAVMNLLGQTVREFDLDGKTTMELPRGVYFVQVNGITKKLVVE